MILCSDDENDVEMKGEECDLISAGAWSGERDPTLSSL
jgi:hypothetical protein